MQALSQLSYTPLHIRSEIIAKSFLACKSTAKNFLQASRDPLQHHVPTEQLQHCVH